MSYGNHKRTWQRVPNALLSYLYNRYMVYTNDKYIYSNVYTLFISSLYHFHKINVFSNVIVLDSSTIFQTYDFILCDTLYDHSYIPFHCSRKTKQNKIENQIKENKENKNKIKIKY